jgi:hypoxanthine-DNA glycosylase
LIKRAFAPVVDAETRLLILGSLPGDASLAAGQYYAHPRNDFWRLIGGVLGCDLVGLAYGARLDAIRAEGIGLWDVIAGAVRPGSLDAAISDPEASDLNALIATLPHLRAVAFNGVLASRQGRRTLSEVPVLKFIDLPSSSAAHARPFAEKAVAWSALGAALR